MPIFAAFLFNVFSALFGFLATYFTKRIALGAASVAMVLAVTVTFYTLIKSLVAGIMGNITNEWLLMGIYACIPGNFETCLTAVLVADTAAFLYRYQLANIRMLLGS